MKQLTNVTKKLQQYILNREKSGIQWKIGTTIITIIILFILYSRGIVVVASINNQPVSLRELILYLRRDDEDNIINMAITQKIIEIEAQKREIIITKLATESEIIRLSHVAAENGKTIYELLNTLEEDSALLEQNVRTRMLLYEIMSSGEPISDEQIDLYFDQNQDLVNSEEREIIKNEIKYLLLNKNISNDYDSWIKNAEASVDVDYLIDLDNI